MGPPASHRITRVPWYSGTGYFTLVFTYRAVTSSGCAFQHTSANLCDRHCRPSTPKTRRLSVWALPISLAATLGIDVSFSSSGYLDVSVHRVPSRTLFIHVRVTRHNSGRVAPFGNPWFGACLRLPMAYRSLPRPSSAPDAKASTSTLFLA